MQELDSFNEQESLNPALMLPLGVGAIPIAVTLHSILLLPWTWCINATDGPISEHRLPLVHDMSQRRNKKIRSDGKHCHSHTRTGRRQSKRWNQPICVTFCWHKSSTEVNHPKLMPRAWVVVPEQTWHCHNACRMRPVPSPQLEICW